MNFGGFRRKYAGPVNKLAYVGMLGDIAVVAGLYLYFRQRKINKLAEIEANREKEIQNNLSVYPKKTEELDYNKFSPYTPIQYYVDPVTRYQHHHIDLVGYLNKNQVNLDNYYFKNYQDSYTEDNSKDYVRDYHDPYIFLEKQNNHSSHGHH